MNRIDSEIPARFSKPFRYEFKYKYQKIDLQRFENLAGIEIKKQSLSKFYALTKIFSFNLSSRGLTNKTK